MAPLVLPPKEFVHPMPAGERYYAVGLFCLVAALLYADQNLMAPNLTQMATEFGFNDTVRLLLPDFRSSYKSKLHSTIPGGTASASSAAAELAGDASRWQLCHAAGKEKSAKQHPAARHCLPLHTPPRCHASHHRAEP